MLQSPTNMPGARDLWAAAIQQVGGDVDDEASDFLIRALIGGKYLEIGVTNSSAVTWLATDAPGAVGLRLAVSPSDSYPFPDAFTIDSGDDGFDEQLTIKTDDAPFARLWLDPTVREFMSSARGYHFLLERGHARAWRFAVGHADEHEYRVSVLRALLALGNRGRLLQTEWSDLASHLGGYVVTHPGPKPAGVLSLQVQLAHETVDIDGFFGGLARRRLGSGLFTRVRCSRRSDHRDQYVIHDAEGRRQLRPRLSVDLRSLRIGHAEFAARYQIECERPGQLQKRLNAETCRRILAAGPAVIVAERHQLTVIFLSFERDPERLRAGIGLARDLALEDVRGELASPYR